MKKIQGFTLAEGATHTNMLQRVSNGFTLAEVLITLAIIGVVAAMTIPTLIAKIRDIVTDNQIKVFNAKLIKGLNLTKTAGDLNDTYTSTYDFLVNGLGKNLKMSKVCDSSHIRDCIPYDKIKFETRNGKENTINVKDITTAKMLNLKAPYEDVASFILADGTPVIVSYNLKCIDDPDKADTEINGCLAGLYDLNGSRKPNKYLAKVEMNGGKNTSSEVGDLRGFNGASVFGTECFGVIGEFCVSGGAIRADDNMLPLIQEKYQTYTMPTFVSKTDGNTYNDYWQLANDYCEKVQGGKLPTMVELAKIAEALYFDASDAGRTIPPQSGGRIGNLTMKNKDAVLAALGLNSIGIGFDAWSGDADGSDGAFQRAFYTNFTEWNYYYHRLRNLKVLFSICIVK